MVVRLGAVWLSVLVAMAGCGETELGTSQRPGLMMVDGEPMVACGNIRPAFAVSAMDNGVAGLADEAEVAAALDDLRAEAGINAPSELQRAAAAKAEWKVLGGDPVDDPERLLVGVGRWAAASGTTHGQYVVLERAEHGWQASGWGDCNLAPVLVEGARGPRSLQPREVQDPDRPALTSWSPRPSALRHVIPARTCMSLSSSSASIRSPCTGPVTPQLELKTVPAIRACGGLSNSADRSVTARSSTARGGHPGRSTAPNRP